VARIAGTHGSTDVARRIRARRGGALRPLDELLLHSPALADGWSVLLGAIRGGIGLPADVRELVVMRIAVLNRAEYEWAAHEPHALAAGLTGRHLEALRAGIDEPFDDRQRAVLAYTDAMTLDIEVPDGVFAEVRACFDDDALVELTATVAAYNMVSRFLVAVEVAA
jgi:alkylhydroperoxidase family enzyme